jgi:integrase
MYSKTSATKASKGSVVISTAIGRWTGTSAKMIDNHYGATNFTNLRPPNLA